MLKIKYSYANTLIKALCFLMYINTFLSLFYSTTIFPLVYFDLQFYVIILKYDFAKKSDTVLIVYNSKLKWNQYQVS